MSAVCTDESVRMLVAGPRKFSHEKQKAKIPVTMTELKQEVSLSDIYKAKMRIDEFYQSTPCTKTCFGVDFGFEVTLKEENLSPTGSYFDRAVLNSLLVLPEDQRRRGVITASECRPFIRALFHYGPKFGIPVTLVVPLGSEIQKQIWSQPGRVIVSCGNDMQEAKRCAAELSMGVRLEYIDSDHSPTMLAGLGTLGLEILEQCGSKFDAIIVPGNDKKLLTAIRCSVKSIFPHVRIIGILTNDKDLTPGSNLPTTSNVSDDILQVGNADVSQAVIRIFEEKSEDGIAGLAAAMSANLTQLQNTRVVVVSSECLVPGLLQLEQVINKGPAA